MCVCERVCVCKYVKDGNEDYMNTSIVIAMMARLISTLVNAIQGVLEKRACEFGSFVAEEKRREEKNM